ncbi:CoA pyrophosphatase [Aestuariibius sp. 2305UL40-4]|uniref:CoA pyrophosphatase n=1 Tax=Aestuariibius violaceus TaxID=3234132 RepID=UPI00345F01F7
MTAKDDLARIAAALRRPGPPSSDYDLNADIQLPPTRKLRHAAVLVPLIETGSGFQILLTKRSHALKMHPGQIAFPGGKQDPTDPTLTATALREAREETGLPETHVDLIGEMPPHETVTGFTVTPIIGHVTAPFDPIPEPGEVDEIFRVPLTHATDPANFRIEARQWQGKPRHFYTVPYGPYYIWGATARILRALAERLS